MVELSGDYRHIDPLKQYNPNPLPVVDFVGGNVRCEDCTAAPVCKKIDNFRSSCDPKSGKRSDGQEKCIAGTNILLWKLLEALARKG